jgi:hypothetical protein
MTMRLVACALSTVLLSGCSWLGLGGNSSQSNGYNTQSTGRYNGAYGQNTANAGLRGVAGPCQITSPTQRIPQGCRPEQVTLAVGGAQNAGYAPQGQYTSGSYGSHVQNVYGSSYQVEPERRKKRPWIRGQFGLEIDHSVSGDIYDPGVSGSASTYNRAEFQEGFINGDVQSGNTVTTIYTSVPERIAAPTISYDDVWTAPLRISAGLEFILSDHATVYANGGFTRAEGKKGGGAAIIDELRKIETSTNYVTDAADGVVGSVLGSVTNTTFKPNKIVATYDYDFNELERYDFEVGGRYYFNPIFKAQFERPLTPFVSASGGAAHYNKTTVSENQRQRFLQRAFENTETDKVNGDFYDVNFGTQTDVYDSQWVGYGAVKAGLEWQVTPKTAVAFEAGIKYEQARDFTGGAKGDDIVSVPVTIRGSYNF